MNGNSSIYWDILNYCQAPGNFIPFCWLRVEAAGSCTVLAYMKKMKPYLAKIPLNWFYMLLHYQYILWGTGVQNSTKSCVIPLLHLNQNLMDKMCPFAESWAMGHFKACWPKRKPVGLGPEMGRETIYKPSVEHAPAFCVFSWLFWSLLGVWHRHLKYSFAKRI